MNRFITWSWRALAVVLLGAYVWNAYRYDVWSSYDAGGHLAYAVDLGLGTGLPNPATNYLAWHEPGYYWLIGVGARAVGALEWSRSHLYHAWQLVSAVVMWSGAVAAGVLAWQVTRRRNTAWFIGVGTASLFCWSALARYVTNESLFQAATLWWLVWFVAWRMDDHPQWSRPKWVLLSLGLAALLWIKLTAVVIIAAVVLWIGLQRGVHVRTKIGWAAVIIAITGGLYAPWLYHKQQTYGQALTINNYETKSERMPGRFFIGWDNSILTTPFWTAGRGSFASMFLASAVVDYDNIFEVYDRPQTTDLVTGNGRRLAAERAVASVQLVRWSLGLVAWVIGGLVIFLGQWLRNRAAPTVQLLACVSAGLVVALMYNVWQYPFLGRGTLKAIFVAAALPLAAIVASAAWYRMWPHRSRIANGVMILYWLVWVALSWRIGLLPV